MKKMTKIFLTSGVTLVLGTGAVLSYLQAQPVTPLMSDLTLANIESLAVIKDCIAEAVCPSGATISCSGGSTCESGPNNSGGSYVLCDGKYGSSCN